MASRPRGGIPVRGICKAGHVTERESDPGRVTWNGECAHEGCDHQVYARRIPRDATPPPPAPDEDTGSTRVVRVDDYDDTSSGAPDDPGGFVVADTGANPADDDGDQHGDPPASGGSGQPAGGPADPIDERHRPSLGRRLAERGRAARIRSARQPYRHPLGI